MQINEDSEKLNNLSAETLIQVFDPHSLFLPGIPGFHTV